MTAQYGAAPSGDDLAYPVQALWEIFVLSGADVDGDGHPDAMIAGMGYEGFARVVVAEVQRLRDDYDDALARVRERELAP